MTYAQKVAVKIRKEFRPVCFCCLAREAFYEDARILCEQLRALKKRRGNHFR